MRILLTGASGFFGSHILRQLLENTGHELAVLIRSGREFSLPKNERVFPIAGDLTDPSSLRRAVQGCQAVVHAAAKVETWARDRGEFDRVNVDGTLDLLRTAGEAGAGKIIYVSSFLALGSSGGSPLDESSPHERDCHFNNYERTKYRANLMVQEMACQGLPVITLYPAVMYGPGPLTAGNLVSNLVLDHLRGHLLARIGHGRQRWCFMHVEDAARGVIKALELAGPGSRYILGGQNADLNEFFDILASVSGKPAPRMALPFGLARSVGAGEEFLAKLTGRMPQLTRGVVDIFRRDWEFDSSLAVRELGFCARPLREGLEQTVSWLRSGILREAR